MSAELHRPSHREGGQPSVASHHASNFTICNTILIRIIFPIMPMPLTERDQS